MPTARSGGVAVVHGGKIYVAGGRVPRGNDFAVYDPAADRWEVLPDLPASAITSPARRSTAASTSSAGVSATACRPVKSDAHEVFDPQTRTWTTAAPMLRGRSGMNGVVARGCFHVWGGEAPTGMTPDHDYYDPRTDKWASLRNMPIPIHGVVGSAFVDGLIWATGGGHRGRRRLRQPAQPDLPAGRELRVTRTGAAGWRPASGNRLPVPVPRGLPEPRGPR
jgi:hypothetical protein